MVSGSIVGSFRLHEVNRATVFESYSSAIRLTKEVNRAIYYLLMRLRNGDLGNKLIYGKMME